MVVCPKCGEDYPEWRKACPKCGAGQEPERKRSSVPYIAAGLIVLVIVIAYILLFVVPTLPLPSLPVPPSATTAPVVIPNPPSPPPALSAKKQAGGKIVITVIGGPTLSQVAAFEVRLNTAIVPVALAPLAGASVTIDGTAGRDQLIVVARYANGADMIVLNQNL